jgi:hypothetical protein
MTVLSLPYNHTLGRFFSGDNRPDHIYKLNLYTDFVFNASATTKAAAEVGCVQLATGLGYVQNDKTLTGVVVTITGNDCFFDANNVQWVANGGVLAAIWAMLYNDSQGDDPPVLAINFGGSAAVQDGAPFDVIWNAAGIINVQTA